MKRRIVQKGAALVFLAASLTTHLVWAEAGNDGKATLQQLEQECEYARENALLLIRARYVEECVQKGDKDRPACERFYADYGDTIRPAGKRFSIYQNASEHLSFDEVQNAAIEACQRYV